MQKTVLKQHYKFTLYKWETYYSEDVKSYYWDDKFIYKNKTWLNNSCYKKVFSLNFFDENQLKDFLKKRYPNENYVSFNTTLNNAIKNNTLYNGKKFIAIISTSTDLDIISFKLKKNKKINKYPKKKINRHFKYCNDYDYFDKEIKRKKIEEFDKNINLVFSNIKV